MNFNLADRANRVHAGAKEKEKEKEVEKVEKDESYLPTHYTDEEQEKLLTGYDLVPEAAWMLLRPKTHVRYETKRGDFRRGGFVHNVKVKGKPMIFLETGFDPKVPGYRKWPVTLEDVEKLWKKRTLEDVKIAEAQSSSASPELMHRIDVLEQSQRSLDIQVTQLQDENKKLLRILGKLNDKIVKIARGGSPGTSPAQPRPQNPGFAAARGGMMDQPHTEANGRLLRPAVLAPARTAAGY
jgi:hypothetical protein